MELKLKIGYQELLQLIKQLPVNQLTKLKAELNEVKIEEREKGDVFSFQELLLKGPTMSETQYEQYLFNRKYFSLWRTN